MSINYFSESITPSEINSILYHDHCMDGATAAFCAFSFLGDSAKYIPCSYERTTNTFENLANKTLLFLDFSLRREAFIKLQRIAKKVFVLDHHLTAQSELHGLNNVHINLNKCGSSLAWDFFNSDKPQPKFIQYVEDIDLWSWKQKDSYYFSLGFYQLLKQFNFNFKIITDIFSDEGVSDLISTGQKLYLTLESKIQMACKQILTTKIQRKNDDLIFGLIECEEKTLANDIAIFALKNLNIDGVVLFYKYNNAQRKFSLRRLRDNNKIPMNKIAELFSGGGHAHAASFLSGRPPLEIFSEITHSDIIEARPYENLGQAF